MSRSTRARARSNSEENETFPNGSMRLENQRFVNVNSNRRRSFNVFIFGVRFFSDLSRTVGVRYLRVPPISRKVVSYKWAMSSNRNQSVKGMQITLTPLLFKTSLIWVTSASWRTNWTRIYLSNFTTSIDFQGGMKEQNLIYLREQFKFFKLIQ